MRDQQGRLVIHEDELDGYRVRRYRPRIEGLFARIERWSKIGFPAMSTGVRSPATTSSPSTALTPTRASPTRWTQRRIFSWLICETRDDKGNAVLYRYKAEDGLGADLGKAHERNRGKPDEARRTANRYLKRIYYGNRTPLLDQAGHRPRWLDKPQIDAQIASAGWMFEAVFDYGDHDPAVPMPNDDQDKNEAGLPRYPWQPRRGPLLHLSPRLRGPHHPPLPAGARCFTTSPVRQACERDCLVRSTDFTYSDEPDPADAQQPGLHVPAARSPSRAIAAATAATTSAACRRWSSNTPSPSCRTRWKNSIRPACGEPADRHGRQRLPLDRPARRRHPRHPHRAGRRLVLQAQPQPRPRPAAGRPAQVKAQFAPLEAVARQAQRRSSATAREFMDLAGDGQPDLVVLDGPVPGLYEHDEAEGWQPFRPFTSRAQPRLA